METLAESLVIGYPFSRLATIGCDPGVVDGVIDSDTAAAYECERRQHALQEP